MQLVNMMVVIGGDYVAGEYDGDGGSGGEKIPFQISCHNEVGLTMNMMMKKNFPGLHPALMFIYQHQHIKYRVFCTGPTPLKC